MVVYPGYCQAWSAAAGWRDQKLSCRPNSSSKYRMLLKTRNFPLVRKRPLQQMSTALTVDTSWWTGNSRGLLNHYSIYPVVRCFLCSRVCTPHTHSLGTCRMSEGRGAQVPSAARQIQPLHMALLCSRAPMGQLVKEGFDHSEPRRHRKEIGNFF